jgi:hypothetical protein
MMPTFRSRSIRLDGHVARAGRKKYKKKKNTNTYRIFGGKARREDTLGGTPSRR